MPPSVMIDSPTANWRIASQSLNGVSGELSQGLRPKGEFRQLSGREIALKLKDDEASCPPIIEFLLFGPQSCFAFHCY